MKYAMRHAAFLGLLAASLAGVLTLADPGPGLMLGLRTAASEILTSFSARYDFNLAGRQCTYLALVVLAFAIPLSVLAAPRLAAAVLPRQIKHGQAIRHGWASWIVAAGLLSVGLVFVLLPWIGLSLPLVQGGDWSRAWREVNRTWFDTLIFAVGAGVTGTATLGNFLITTNYLCAAKSCGSRSNSTSCESVGNVRSEQHWACLHQWHH